MITFLRTDRKHAHFKKLVAQLDSYLATIDGDEHTFYAQFNTSDRLDFVILAYTGKQALGCGALKIIDQHTLEIKRMYINRAHRNKGIASQLLSALEQWSQELGYRRCILEVGRRQPDAVRLYQKNGFNRIANYGQYVGIENSLCFEKVL